MLHYKKQQVDWVKHAQPNTTSTVDTCADLQVNSRKMSLAHHLCFVDSPSYLHDGRGASYALSNKPKKRHPQGDATTNKQNVGWAKRAQPNMIASDSSIVGLRYALHQPTVRTNIFNQSKLKPPWCECHQANLFKVLKTLQSNSVSYVVVIQQGYVNNKLRKRKVSQIYISNNLNSKEAI